MLQKAAVDLIIVEYPDGLPVLGVSKFPGQVPNWNKQVQNLSFFYNNNLEVKEKWIIVNSLHFTHPMHNSKRVSKSVGRHSWKFGAQDAKF